MIFSSLKNFSSEEVKKFQERHGLPVTGVVDNSTWDLLSSINEPTMLAVPAPSEYTRKHTTYTVKVGDSLWLISQKSGLSVAEIRTLNNLKSDILYIGQELKIPKR